MSTVKLKYSAMSNVTFRGEVDTKIEWDEWREMSQDSRDEEINYWLFELVDIGPEEDPDNEVGDQGA